jgi:L-ascorbate metabolism protein UlaG (beta-lactamase superfamily)
MKIRFYAHSCFRLEGESRTIITDPYEPRASRFAPINEPADLVLMSSNTDRFHCDPSHVQGTPRVVNALDIDGRETINGLEVRAFRARERWRPLVLLRGGIPRASAMYAFTLDGLRIFHSGDIGRRFKPEEIDELRGKVDVMFAISGGVHNIEVDDMKAAIDAIAPKIAIPMHYFSSKGRLKRLLPVDEMARRFPADRVTRVGGSELEVTPATLPAETHLVILEQSR